MAPPAMDSSPASETSTLDASPFAQATGAQGHGASQWKGASQNVDTLQASLEDALAQLEVARQQRTEVSAQLFKFRCAVDELREQKAQLQSELNRRLQTHKEDVDRIMSLQDECDTMRRTYNEKQAEIIELSTKIQALMAKLESTEQYNELKEENELLWRRIEDLKKYEALEAAGELAGRDSKWKERFASIEMALNEALESRRSVIGDFEIDNDDVDAPLTMLKVILEAEEKMRKSVSSQLSNLRMELRTAKDSLSELSKKAAENDVAAVKLDMEMARLADAQRRVVELERERESALSKAAQSQNEVDTMRRDLSETRAQLVQVKSTLTHVTSERDALIRKQATEVSNEEADSLRRENNELRQNLSRSQIEILDLKNQKRNIEVRLEAAVSDLKTKEAELQQVGELQESSDSTLSVLRSALDAEKAATRRAEAALTLKSLEVERLEQRVDEQDSLLKAERVKLDQQKRDWDSYRRTVEAKLREQRPSKQEVVSIPSEDVTILEDRIKNLREQLRVKDAAVSRLETKVAELQRFIETEREEFKERNEEWYATEARFEKEIAALKKQQREASTNNNHKVQRELQELRKTLEKQKEQYEATISSYKDQVAELRRNLAHHEEDGGAATTSEDMIERLQESLSESEARVKALEEQISTQKSMISELEEKLQQVQEESDTNEKQEEETKAELERLEAEVESLTETKNQLQEDLTSAQQEAETKLKAVQDELEAAQDELRAAQEEVQAAKESVKSIEKELADERTASKQTILELSSKVECLEARIEGDLSKNLKTLVMDSLKDQTPAEQILRLKTCLQRVTSELKEKEAIVTMHEDRRKECEQENKALQEQIKKVEEGWKQEYEGYLDHLSRVTKTLDRVNAEKKELQETLNKTRSSLQALSANKRAASSNKLSPDTENSSTASSPTSTKEKENLLREKKALEKSVEELKRRCAEIQAERDQLQSRKLTQRYISVPPPIGPAKKSHALLDMSRPQHLAVLVVACYLAYLTGSLTY